MTKRSHSALFLPLTFDPTSSIPLHRQLYDELRRAILSGRLAAGTQLPSTRLLASSLTISRTTVVTVFDQLLREGYVVGKKGSGTYVALELPEELLQKPVPVRAPSIVKTPGGTRGISQRGQILAATDVATVHYYSEDLAFRPGVPDLRHFPFDIWAKLASHHWRHPPLNLLGYSHPAGYHPLRTEIASYLREARGVQCVAEQVIIVSGSQQAIDIAARLLLDREDAVWIEDPGYSGARSALLAAGATLIPIPVDDEGLDVATGITRCPDACMAYITPSYQFPMGTTMSLTRRLLLLQWASKTGAWLLEDDYDSEFRYSGRPLSSLQGLDNSGQVIYIGTFSKVLFPGLRLGYLVVPKHLIDAFTAARAVSDRHSPMLDQIVLTDFIAQGHFARHIRHMRKLYAERQIHLLEEIKRELDGPLRVQPADGGMHLVGMLAQGMDDQKISRQAATRHLITPPLSDYSMIPSQRNALLLGYTAIDKKEISDGVKRLREVISMHSS